MLTTVYHHALHLPRIFRTRDSRFSQKVAVARHVDVRVAALVVKQAKSYILRSEVKHQHEPRILQASTDDFFLEYP